MMTHKKTVEPPTERFVRLVVVPALAERFLAAYARRDPNV